MSSSASRDSTRCSPSREVSSPATVARLTERNRSQPANQISAIEAVPNSAAEKRQPNGSSPPKSHSPTAISHFPSGGCTTKEGWSSTSGMLPETKPASAPEGHCCSVPCSSSEYESLR